jgi:ribosomal protein S27E
VACSLIESYLRRELMLRQGAAMAFQVHRKNQAREGTAAAAVTGFITVECLRCGHRGMLREADLSRYGERSDTPIAAFIKRLKCRKCGSQSVRAFRPA